MDKLRLAGFIVCNIGGMARAALVRAVRGLVHRWTYKGPTDRPKTVAVVGGSFAGVWLMARLADTLPTGWQAVLVEKNSHFNFSFYFPRYAVVPGHETGAFIPYDAIFARHTPGISRRVQGEVVSASIAAADEDKVKAKTKTTTTTLRLADGETVACDVLVVATGSAQRSPAKLLAAADRDAACAELRTVQTRVRHARTVAVVGGGAVGVELAADIRTLARRGGRDVPEDEAGHEGEAATPPPASEVTLVHSRPRLLHRYGPRLHDHVLGVLGRLGVRVVLGQRPTVVFHGSTPDAEVGGPGSLHYADGRREDFDCVFLCTGQTPNSAFVQAACPDAVLDTGEIRVAPTLQVLAGDESSGGMRPLPSVFALGDVAATGGAKMARAAYFQADVVADNVRATIRGQQPKAVYTPTEMEPFLNLSLGERDGVMYMDRDDGASILVPTKGEAVDLGGAKRAFVLLGAQYTEDK